MAAIDGAPTECPSSPRRGRTPADCESARERFNLPASGSVTNTLKSLIQRGVLFETEGSSGYAFDNPFFKHWIHLRNRDDLGLG